MSWKSLQSSSQRPLAFLLPQGGSAFYEQTQGIYLFSFYGVMSRILRWPPRGLAAGVRTPSCSYLVKR